jgi:uncharacterized protein (TIGR02996 family)
MSGRGPEPATPEVAAWIRAIQAEPDDDGPRLAFADWLEGNGNAERAAFIRLKVEQARQRGSPESAGSLEAQDLERRANELERRHAAELEDELPRVPGLLWASPTPDRFARGFVCAIVAADWEAFAAHAEELFAAAPVTDLSLQRLAPASLPALVRSPLLARLRALILPELQVGDAEVALLAASPYVSNLRSLTLIKNNIPGPGARALAGSPHLKNLKELFLTRNKLDKAAKRVLRDAYGDRVVF